MIARKYYISGRVQGVGFRYFVKRKADFYGIAGWVKNLPDGRVEVFAQGDPLVLDEFEKELWKGPSLSRVDDIEIYEVEPTLNTYSFEIKFW